jgi:cytochrome P450
MITGAAWFIQMDEAHYPRAHEFDPWRFYDKKTNTATTKSTTATNTFLAFGYGSQSCPGRFLGVRLTQIVFAKMLMRYEFGWEDGQKGRPENVVLPGQLLPQYMATIVLREREGV